MRLSNTLPSCCWCVWLWSGEELLCWPRGDECDHCTVTVVSKWRGSANLMMRPERLPLMIGWKFIKRENSGSIMGLLGKILVTLLWPLETPFKISRKLYNGKISRRYNTWKRMRRKHHSYNTRKNEEAKGSLPNMKCHKFWKKSQKRANIKIVYISSVDYFETWGGVWIFFFAQM